MKIRNLLMMFFVSVSVFGLCISGILAEDSSSSSDSTKGSEQEVMPASSGSSLRKPSHYSSSRRRAKNILMSRSQGEEESDQTALLPSAVNTNNSVSGSFNERIVQSTSSANLVSAVAKTSPSSNDKSESQSLVGSSVSQPANLSSSASLTVNSQSTTPVILSASAAQASAVMPSIGAPSQSDPNGNITFTFIGGTLNPAGLSSLGANVTYDGKTEYWVLSPGMISADGTSMHMQLGSEFNGKQMKFAFVAKDLAGDQTLFSNTVSVLIDSGASGLTMPTVNSASCDVNGNVTFALSSALKPTDLQNFWAQVTYDNKTYYWELTPGVLSADGRTVKLQLGSEFNAKSMKFAFFGIDNSGKKTTMTNEVSVVIDSGASGLTMPTVNSASCDVNGNVTFALSSALKPTDLQNFWAQVTYDNKTYYWELTPGVLSADGKTVSLQLGSEFNAKSMKFAFFGIDNSGKKTTLTNEVSVVINSSASSLVMPTVGSPSCDVNGNVTFALSSALKPTDLKNFWAQVTYDGKTYYWELTTGVLSADGKTVSIQLDSSYNNKTMKFAFFGIDNSGKKTLLSNEVSVLIDSSASSLVMPTVGSPSCDVNGNVTFALSSALKPTDLKNFWAQVTYDGKTYYWELTSGVLSTDGRTVSLQLGSEFNAKTMKFAFFGIDNSGKKTLLSNEVSVLINSSASSLVMPTVSSASSDVNGNVTFTLSSALKPTDLKNFWAQVTYDNKTYYWELTTGVLSADGKTVNVQLDSSYNGKTVKFAFFGIDNSGKKTTLTNEVSVVINSSLSSLVMPNISAPAKTDVNGNVTFSFTNGTLKPGDISDLGANVTINGAKPVYWILNSGMISADGKTITMQLGPEFNGMTMDFQFIAKDTAGKLTSFSNKVSVLVDSSASSLVMPNISAPASTDVNGNVAFTFTTGTLKPSDITDLGANVTYDGKTVYWVLNPAMISADGKTISMQLGPEFDAKTMQFQFIAKDNNGKLTAFSNKVSVLVDSNSSSLVMPAISAPAKSDVNGNVTFTFTNGTLKPGDISDLGVNVTVDGKTEYWILNPSIISTDGKTIILSLGTQYNGKTVDFQFIAKDNNGKQTAFSNKVSVLIDSGISSLLMPAVSAPSGSDANGNVLFTFTNGTLKPTDISDLGVNVTVDGKTEYWMLNPGMISADGKTISLQLDSKYDGKILQFQFIAKDLLGRQTSFSNKVSVLIDSGASSLLMPNVSAPAKTDVSGNVVFSFINGTLNPADISAFGANVTFGSVNTEYWILNTDQISTDGKTINMSFGSQYDAKTVQIEFIAKDKAGKPTAFSNKVSVLIDSKPTSLVMPDISAPSSSDVNGNVVFTFVGGVLKPADISDLGVNVTVDGKSEYWALNPGIISADGKTMIMPIDSKYDGKLMQFEFIAKDLAGKQTSFSNPVSVLIDSNPSSLIMPQITTTGKSDPNGKVVLTFSNGTLKPGDITSLGANVSVNGGNPEYWVLNPADVLSTDGKTITMTFGVQYDAKTIQIEFTAKDLLGKQTLFSNKVGILIDSKPSSVVIPQISASSRTDSNGNIVFNFVNGTLLASDLSEIGANVSFDGGKTEYWELNTGMISVDGKSMSMQIPSIYNGKTMLIEFIAKDKFGKWTAVSNISTVFIDNKPTI